MKKFIETKKPYQKSTKENASVKTNTPKAPKTVPKPRPKPNKK